MPKIGAALSLLMREKGFSGKKLAEMVGVTQATVSRWRENVSPVSPDNLQLIAAALGVTVPDLTKVAKSEPDKSRGVPFYDIDVSASHIDMFSDSPDFYRPNLRISIPGFEDCDVALPIFGHSMYPTYENGCIIMCKELTDRSVIQYGEPHLVIMDEQRFVKRLQKSERVGWVRCVSDNGGGDKRYEPFEVEVDKIKKLYIVKGSIKRTQL